CACTRVGEAVDVGGVRVLGASNLAATVPSHASQVYARNLLALVQLLSRDGRLAFDPADEVLGPMALTHAGEIRAR
ncbi:MAG TPA: NAD(P)(+) transhydrogenase (Re/Si-specific) subunit alpha, partial [Anaeromyxobacteraceae bacterium]